MSEAGEAPRCPSGGRGGGSGAVLPHLVVVVVQVGVGALQLHHLDLGDPLLLLLAHQVAVGISGAPVPRGPASVPMGAPNTQVSRQTPAVTGGAVLADSPPAALQPLSEQAAVLRVQVGGVVPDGGYGRGRAHSVAVWRRRAPKKRSETAARQQGRAGTTTMKTCNLKINRTLKCNPPLITGGLCLCPPPAGQGG